MNEPRFTYFPLVSVAPKLETELVCTVVIIGVLLNQARLYIRHRCFQVYEELTERWRALGHQVKDRYLEFILHL